MSETLKTGFLVMRPNHNLPTHGTQDQSSTNKSALSSPSLALEIYTGGDVESPDLKVNDKQQTANQVLY